MKIVMVDGVEVPVSVVDAMSTVRNFAGLVAKRTGNTRVTIAINSGGSIQILKSWLNPAVSVSAPEDEGTKMLLSEDEQAASRDGIMQRREMMEIAARDLQAAIDAEAALPEGATRRDRKAAAKKRVAMQKAASACAVAFDMDVADYIKAGGTYPFGPVAYAGPAAEESPTQDEEPANA